LGKKSERARNNRMLNKIMKHKDKVKIARKMLSKEEIKNHCPIFMGKNWVNRKEKRQEKHLKNNSKKI
jgi:hypothetical protein